MMKMDKNLNEVQQMLKGEHKTQTKKMFGFTPPKVERKVGDIWPEYNEFGEIKEWVEKKEGYLFRSNIHPEARQRLQEMRDELAKFPNCPKEVCDSKQTKLDKKFRFKTGMCADCTCKMEDDLRIAGKFEEYSKAKMLDKATSTFKDSDAVLEEIVAPLRRGYFEEVQPDGSIKKSPVDPGIADQIVQEYIEYKNDVLSTIQT